tara:strand:+ start:572 stop:2035 length:1464 start_codon:yes stop_codon:yes gene_type:complete
MNIVWFKRDLRIVDQPALAMAINHGPIIPLVIIEPELWEQPDLSYRHFKFYRDCLKSLQTQLADHGYDLHIEIGDARSVLSNYHEKLRFTQLFSTQETWNGWTYERDKTIHDFCKANRITWHEPTQNGVIRRLKNRDGWAKHWQDFMNQPYPNIKNKSPIPPSGIIPNAKDIGHPIDDNLDIQEGGTQQANNLLHSFLFTRGKPYTKAMSSPVSAFDACSRLSAHIAFGSISIREVTQKTHQRYDELKALPKTPDVKLWKSAMRSFLGRLHWHCHFIQKLEDDPSMEFQSLHSMYRPLDDAPLEPSLYEHWKNGSTGFPLVDACMRALHQTGWLNFRMRAMVMSIATHHLGLPWRPCALYLATQFTDYEPGIHYSQCQMQAGRTGINTIRIYNPIKQSMDQDPDGIFIRRWVPELRNVPSSGVHQPWHYGHKQPIVDEKLAREQASKRLYSVRKQPYFRDEASNIVKKHGSRRRIKKAPNQLKLNLE